MEAHDTTSVEEVYPRDIASESNFADCILRAVLTSHDVYSADNIDPEYPAPGFLPDGADPVKTRIGYLRFVLDNSERLYRTFTLLADEASKELFWSLILFRILGYRRVRLPVDHGPYFAARRLAAEIPAVASTLDAAVNHFEFSHTGKVFHLDCLKQNLFFSFFLKQYYLRRSGVVIQPDRGDIVVDAGACFGDTAIEIAQHIGSEGHVYSFEVLQSHLDIFNWNLKQNPEITNITIFPCALGNCDRSGSASIGPVNPGYTISETAPVCSLDSLVEHTTIPRVDFIKMDIEGYELAALEGAVRTITRFRPKLAISLYHHESDYYQIPEFIDHLGMGYRMFLDNYTISDGETILYGIADA